MDDAALPIAARFFSGIVFPRHDQRTTRVGGSILWTALAKLTGADALSAAYTRHGDVGDMVGDVLAGRPTGHQSLEWTASRFALLAAERGTGGRRRIVHDTLAALGTDEARGTLPSCSMVSCGLA